MRWMTSTARTLIGWWRAGAVRAGRRRSRLDSARAQEADRRQRTPSPFVVACSLPFWFVSQ
jgi:hypothetical protein